MLLIVIVEVLFLSFLFLFSLFNFIQKCTYVRTSYCMIDVVNILVVISCAKITMLNDFLLRPSYDSCWCKQCMQNIVLCLDWITQRSDLNNARFYKSSAYVLMIVLWCTVYVCFGVQGRGKRALNGRMRKLSKTGPAGHLLPFVCSSSRQHSCMHGGNSSCHPRSTGRPACLNSPPGPPAAADYFFSIHFCLFKRQSTMH